MGLFVLFVFFRALSTSPLLEPYLILDKEGMARGNEENTPSKAQNGGTQESRKRKRVVEQGMGDDDVGNKLTSRQLALKQKVESKEAVEALYPPTAGFFPLLFSFDFSLSFFDSLLDPIFCSYSTFFSLFFSFSSS